MADSSSFIEEADYDNAAEYASVPRGGPIFLRNTVSSLTGVPDFEESVFNLLQDLKQELEEDSLDNCDDDFSVDELKIITEEEFVNKALEEVYKDAEVPEEQPSARKESQASASETSPNETAPVFSNNGEESQTSASPTEIAPVFSNNGEFNQSISNKRNRSNNVLEEGQIEKVEKIASNKQKQDEEKAAARSQLHSFNCRRKTKIFPVPSREIEQMKSLKSLNCAAKVISSSTNNGQSAAHYPQVLLSVEVLHHSNRKVTQEFMMLGRQFLTELKDKIYCLTDGIMRKAGEYNPSGYFLIENVFCSDLRDPSAIDYTKPILHWLGNCKEEAVEKWECIVSGELRPKQKMLFCNGPKAKLPQFRVLEMQKTRFCDLRFRLGAEYVYCHHGDCKHLIVIRDMRWFHPEDVQNRAAYPLVRFQSSRRFRKCSVCKIYKAEKVTVDDKWSPENPCYFCDICYYMLHYSNGCLLYNDFSVYDYLHE